jgi:hypothetical protein
LDIWVVGFLGISGEVVPAILLETNLKNNDWATYMLTPRVAKFPIMAYIPFIIAHPKAGP